MVIQKIKFESGSYPGIITNVKGVKDDTYLIVTVKINLSDNETLSLDKWYDAKPFWGTPLNFMAEKMGLLEDDDSDDINFNDLIYKDVLVDLSNSKGSPKIRSIRPSDDV